MLKLTSEVAEAVYSQSAKIGQTRITAKRCVGEKKLFCKSCRKWSLLGYRIMSKLTYEVAEAVYSQSAKIGKTSIMAKRCIGDKNLLNDCLLKIGTIFSSVCMDAWLL